MCRSGFYKVMASICFLFCVNEVFGEDIVFNSYHLYMADEDKYVPTNVQNDSSVVCIDEINQKIELKLHNTEIKQWMLFSLKVKHKVDIGSKKLVTLYLCTNNADQECGVCVCNLKDGLFVQFYHFYEEGNQKLSYWAKAE